MKFLNDPSMVRLRPFLDARMPTFHFTEKEINTLTAYFSAVDKVDYPLMSTYVETTPERLRDGAALFKTLQCDKCHPTGSSNPAKPQKEWAPNLNLTQARLRPDWLLEWLKDPQAIFPGAGMPASFPDYPKSSIKDVYNGDAKGADPGGEGSHLHYSRRRPEGRFDELSCQMFVGCCALCVVLISIAGSTHSRPSKQVQRTAHNSQRTFDNANGRIKSQTAPLENS
jgi:hypothetical protein